MLELLDQVNHWVTANKPFVMATVIETWGSSPRPVGSALIVNEDMEMAGSVSGGCVEGAVVKEAMRILSNNEVATLPFGVRDEDAWSVGLSCGGKMKVFAEKFLAFSNRISEKEVWEEWYNCLINNRGCVLLSSMEKGVGNHFLVLDNGDTLGGAIPDELLGLAQKAFRERKSQIVEASENSYFAWVFPRKSQLIIVGAAHITKDLITLGNMYDFETIVIDPRGIFAEKTQFPNPPHQLHVKWPAEVLESFALDNYAYAVLLTHDPKIDDQALEILLRSDIGYIGALGSKKTHEKRVARLEKAGFSPEIIGRIHAPIGVDINAKRPKEIALSIMGEIIKKANEFL